MKKTGKILTASMTAAALAASSIQASSQDFSKYSDEAIAEALADRADVRMIEMVAMRDGVRLATNIYMPKDADWPLPTILWKTPYNELSYQDRTSRRALEAVSRGFAFVVQNERGRYYSEGKYEILGYPQTDGYDTISWIADQPWSNGKVGTLGCSSSAEWQLALAAMDHPAHAAMVPMAAGAGIGKVGPFQEQGNWYTGGVPRSLFFVWLYGVDNPLRAQLPGGLDQPTQAQIARYNDLAAKKPAVDWTRQIRHLPLSTLLSDLGEPAGTYENLIARSPADPEWKEGGLYHDDMGWGVPALWFNSWYDVSIGPNMALFNHARSVNTDKKASSNQYAVIGPNNHCRFSELGPDFVSGDRELGDASFPVDDQVYSFFDRWLKGETRAFPASTAPVRYFTMGTNEWQSATQWPPKSARDVTLHLRSSGGANSLYGDGRLSVDPPRSEEIADRYIYDPANPVQTVGGGDCCNGGLVKAGAFDQRLIEARDDVLVYTSEPLTDAMEVSGFVETVLSVSSDARDTDFAVKLVDVAPDGTAHILGDTILRARYRTGFDNPQLMEAGEVYQVSPTPITISNTFLPGHRIRIEVTSSNFPKFARNLNTGGSNETESEFVIAHNTVHHSPGKLSYIKLPVVPADR
ncbi:CocE/NonD family hydrolase [Altererythrobacter sp. SALINAS58]|uniref:CocE/NonD family hydrolase n=1 Tax=Alteripontixanthobacter muriae TaxID=2705546 RepID=UPI0015769A93|nr:CocE/NonD family hydrolase [Alteripontixanthobacter muriae]NTZ43267.1 CocE/NonD family hydrolase [Alteripontixanthobacter muriae]